MATACWWPCSSMAAKSDALDLTYDPKTGQLSFAPPGVSLYLGP